MNVTRIVSVDYDMNERRIFTQTVYPLNGDSSTLAFKELSGQFRDTRTSFYRASSCSGEANSLNPSMEYVRAFRRGTMMVLVNDDKSEDKLELVEVFEVSTNRLDLMDLNWLQEVSEETLKGLSPRAEEGQ